MGYTYMIAWYIAICRNESALEVVGGIHVADFSYLLLTERCTREIFRESMHQIDHNLIFRGSSPTTGLAASNCIVFL